MNYVEKVIDTLYELDSKNKLDSKNRFELLI